MAVPKFVGESVIWKNIFSERSVRKGSTQELLSRVPAFAHLTFRELKEVAAIVHKREYRAGEPVFYQGDPGLGMYIVQEGTVSIALADKDNAQKELVVLSEGDFFGELGLLDESPRSASAICKTECLLIGFFRPDLLDLIERKPSLGIKIVLKLAEIVGERLRKTDKELSKLKSQMDALQSELERRSNGEENSKEADSPARKAES
ncbi:MAG: cyclic nucleotide-binding domain-containing protein [Ignavibacteriales bacterium]|nr:cyclic nucleotide-binding domain-containing protein [Ignavibacteriales bacterium]